MLLLLLLLLVMVAQHLPSSGDIVGIGAQCHATQMNSDQVSTTVRAMQLWVGWRTAGTATADPAKWRSCKRKHWLRRDHNINSFFTYLNALLWHLSCTLNLASVWLCCQTIWAHRVRPVDSSSVPVYWCSSSSADAPTPPAYPVKCRNRKFYLKLFNNN